MEQPKTFILFSGIGFAWSNFDWQTYFHADIQLVANLLEKCSTVASRILKKFVNLPLLLSASHSFVLDVDHSLAAVALTAFQICAVECLKMRNINWDGIMSHSLGEFAAGYASGHLSLEEAVAMAAIRCLVLVQNRGLFPNSRMLAVHQSPLDVQDMDEKDICIGCINSDFGITLVGAVNKIREQKLKFQELNVETHSFDNGGIPYHSQALSPLLPLMTQALQIEFSSESKRSNSWISSFANAGQINAAYFAEAAIAQVDFAAALQQIPEKSVILEIGITAMMRKHVLGRVPTFVYKPLASISEMSAAENENVS
jgi:acyl transferase domain-containing protein